MSFIMAFPCICIITPVLIHPFSHRPSLCHCLPLADFIAFQYGTSFSFSYTPKDIFCHSHDTLFIVKIYTHTGTHTHIHTIYTILKADSSNRRKCGIHLSEVVFHYIIMISTSIYFFGNLFKISIFFMDE